MADEAQTQPMLKTILEKIDALDAKVEQRFTSIEGRLARIEIRLDKIESIALDARATANEMQLDLKRLREQLNLPIT